MAIASKTPNSPTPTPTPNATPFDFLGDVNLPPWTVEVGSSGDDVAIPDLPEVFAPDVAETVVSVAVGAELNVAADPVVSVVAGVDSAGGVFKTAVAEAVSEAVDAELVVWSPGTMAVPNSEYIPGVRQSSPELVMRSRCGWRRPTYHQRSRHHHRRAHECYRYRKPTRSSSYSHNTR